MARTAIRSEQIGEEQVKRADLNVSTSGSAVIAKVIAGDGIELASTGPDPGTGDVTISATATGGGGPPIAIFQLRGVGGNSITSGSWQDVLLTTEARNDIPGCSAPSGVPTLGAGTYWFAYLVAANVDQQVNPRVQCRIYNNTGGAEVTNSGGTVLSAESGIVEDPRTLAGQTEGNIVVVPTGTTAYKLQVRTATDATYPTAAGWTSELAAELVIVKLA